jgi:hypothetical protein
MGYLRICREGFYSFASVSDGGPDAYIGRAETRRIRGLGAEIGSRLRFTNISRIYPTYQAAYLTGAGVK